MSSSDSDSRSSRKEKCCLPEPFDDTCDILKHYKGSVVSVSTQTVLSTLAAGTIPTGTPTDTAVIWRSQSGFFFAGGKKNQSTILTPATGVLINPTLLAGYNRFPAEAGVTGVPTGLIPNRVARVSRIVVTVWGVTKKRCRDLSYTFEANLLGVDATRNLAVLVINHPKGLYNDHTKAEKCIKNIPYICPVNAKNVCDGQDVYIIGDFATSPSYLTTAGGGVGIVKGNIEKRRFFDTNGRNLVEQMLISGAGVYSPKAGAVVLDCRGLFVGMVTSEPNGPVSSGDGYLAATTTRALLKGSFTILQATKKKCKPEQLNDTVLVQDPLGTYRYVTHPWLGIGYRTVDELTYLEKLVPSTASPYLNIQPILDPTAQYQLTNGPKCKRIVGIQVTSIAGNSLPIGVTGATGFFVPGGAAGATVPLLGFASVFPPSPIVGEINIGDIITAVNGIPIGNGPDQVAPSLVVWKCPPNCSPCDTNSIELTVRRAADDWNTPVSVIASSNARPAILEYPWQDAYKQAAISAPVAVATPVLPSLNFVNAL